MYGENIKKYRLRAGKTQEDLAAYLGVAPQTIYKYEKEINEPDAKTFSKLADYFNITVDELLGRTFNQPIQIAASTENNLDLSDLSEKGKEYIKELVEKMRNTRN